MTSPQVAVNVTDNGDPSVQLPVSAPEIGQLHAAFQVRTGFTVKVQVTPVKLLIMFVTPPEAVRPLRPLPATVIAVVVVVELKTTFPPDVVKVRLIPVLSKV